jgi:hypothetical protein
MVLEHPLRKSTASHLGLPIHGVDLAVRPAANTAPRMLGRAVHVLQRSPKVDRFCSREMVQAGTGRVVTMSRAPQSMAPAEAWRPQKHGARRSMAPAGACKRPSRGVGVKLMAVTSGETRTVASGETRTVTSGETRTVTSGETRTVTSGETRTVTSGETRTVTSGAHSRITELMRTWKAVRRSPGEL